MSGAFSPGLRGIRRRRSVAFVLIASALPILLVLHTVVRGIEFFVAFLFVWLVVLGSWLAFLYSPCPRCAKLFFVAGDPARSPFALTLGADAFRSRCAHCDLSLREGATR